MELTNDFVIDRNIEETWTILNDIEFIAPCMPGARLTEVEGDEYRGNVKIKVGPITAHYKGKASFIEQDAEAKVARLKAEGRDPRQGNANAEVKAEMEAVSDTSTKVTIHTDLKLSGKVASFGRGMIEEISAKLLGQFVDNLREKLETEGAPAEDAAAESADAGDSAVAAADGADSNGDAAARQDTVRNIDSDEQEAVDLLAVSGESVGKRLAPVLGAIVLLLLLRWFFKGRAG